MWAIFGLGYVISAGGFFFAFTKSAKPTPFPKWIWEQSNAQQQHENSDRLAA